MDAQTSFAKLFADIGTQEDVHADLATLLVRALRVTAKYVQALRGLRHSRTRWPHGTHSHRLVWLLQIPRT